MGAETRAEAMTGLSAQTEALLIEAMTKIRKNLIEADARAAAGFAAEDEEKEPAAQSA